MSDDGWTQVTKGARRSKKFNRQVEFAVELLPAFADALFPLVQWCGLDTASKFDVVESYVAPYLVSNVSLGKPNVPRKSKQVAQESRPLILQEQSHRGFINICQGFMHASLAFVNPPVGVCREAASSFIQHQLSQALASMANMDAPEMWFNRVVHRCDTERVWMITSEANGIPQRKCITEFRERLKKLFEDNEWFVRFPVEPIHQIHMRIRDGRYETLQTSASTRTAPSLPPRKGSMRLVFDKLAITPAAQHDARHSFKRQYCGATAYFDIFARTPRIDILSAIQARLVVEELHHVDSASRPNIEADANIAKVLLMTAPDSSSVAAPRERSPQEALFTPKPKCFVPGTLLRAANGNLVAVENVEKHEILESLDGCRVEVVDIKRHAEDEQDLVQLATDKGEEIIVTADHRIMVRRNGKEDTIRAGKLKEEDTVLFAGGERKVSKISWKEHLPVFEIKFNPDLAMETFYIKETHDPMLTKGYKSFTHRSSGKKMATDELVRTEYCFLHDSFK